MEAIAGFAISQLKFLQMKPQFIRVMSAFFGTDPSQARIYSVVDNQDSTITVDLLVEGASYIADVTTADLNNFLIQRGFPMALSIEVILTSSPQVTIATCELATLTTPATCAVNLVFRANLTNSKNTQMPYNVLLASVLNRIYFSVPDSNKLSVYLLSSGELRQVFAGIDDQGIFMSPLHAPSGLALSSDSSSLYVADTLNHCLRSFSPADDVPILKSIGDCGWSPSESSAETTNASESDPGAAGLPLPVTFNRPVAVQGIRYGAELLILDKNSLVLIDASSHAGRLVAGSNTAGFREGVGSAALFNRPMGLAASALRRVAFVADTGNHVVRRVDIDTGAVTLLAGYPWAVGEADGVGTAARFRQPCGVALSVDDQWLYVTDRAADTLRAVSILTGGVRTLARTPPQPCGVAVVPFGTAAYVVHSEGVDRLTLTCNVPGMVRHPDGRCIRTT